MLASAGSREKTMPEPWWIEHWTEDSRRQKTNRGGPARALEQVAGGATQFLEKATVSDTIRAIASWGLTARAPCRGTPPCSQQMADQLRALKI